MLRFGTLLLALSLLGGCTLSLFGGQGDPGWPYDTSGTDSTVDTAVDPDTSPPAFRVKLVQIDREYGMCPAEMECVYKVNFEGAPEVRFTGASLSGAALHEVSGTLTDAGVLRLEQAAARLDGVALAQTYGCPGCTDGGVMTLTRWRDDMLANEVSRYPEGEAPAPIGPADALFRSLLEALSTCTPTDLIAVDPNACPPAP